LEQGWFLPILYAVYWILVTVALGSLTLFFSALFEKGYLAVVGAIGFLIFLEVASNLLGFIFSVNPITEALDVIDNLIGVGLALFTLEIGKPLYFAWQIIMMVVFAVVFGALLFRKINPVEVIK
jgi:hypothetical protein